MHLQQTHIAIIRLSSQITKTLKLSKRSTTPRQILRNSQKRNTWLHGVWNPHKKINQLQQIKHKKTKSITKLVNAPQFLLNYITMYADSSHNVNSHKDRLERKASLGG